MADARTGSSGIVDKSSVSDIVDNFGSSNIFGSNGVEVEENENFVPVGQAPDQNAPIYPEAPMVPYYQPASRQMAFDERPPIPSASPMANRDDFRPRGVEESRMSKEQRAESRGWIPQEDREAAEQQKIQEQQRPRTMREIRGEPSQQFNTEQIEVQPYYNVAPRASEMSLTTATPGRRVSTEDARGVISNYLANQLVPKKETTELEAQAMQADETRTIQDVEQQQQAEENESSFEDVETAVRTASEPGSVKSSGVAPTDQFVDFSPRVNEFEFYDVPSIPFAASQQAAKDSAASSIAKKSWDGNAFTEKAIPNDKIAPGDVSIGSFIIEDIVREPGNNLIEIVNVATGSSFSVEEVLTEEGMKRFADTINSANIDVVATKSPVVGGQDVVARRLRVHYGRGIQVHPTQTKVWTLDFDGDGISVSFDIHDGVKNAINYLVDANDKLKIDIDYFPMSNLLAQNESEFVEVFKLIFLTNVTDRFDIDITPLAKAMYVVANAESLAHEDDFDGFRETAWKAALLEMRALSYRFSNPDIAMSGILKNIFDEMRTAMQYDVADIAAADPSLSLVEQVAADGYEEPADRLIHEVIGTMAKGNLPPNFQDFIIGLHNYIGEVEGKNVMFRIGAKYAKVIKASSTEFQGDEESYRLFYRLCLEAGEAMFMSGRFSIGERVAYAQKIAKDKIIASVGFSGSRRYNGSTAEWLQAFKTEYNKQMRLIECSNFGGFSCDLDKNPDPDVRSYYINGDELSALVKPLITVYGEYTPEYMFRGIKFSDFIENGYHSRLEKNILTLLDAYRYKSLKDISNNNLIYIPDNLLVTRMIKAKGEEKRHKERVEIKFHEMKISECNEVLLMLAIANKRTAAASKYHKDTLVPLLGNFSKAFTKMQERYSKVKNKDDVEISDLADFEIWIDGLMSCLHLSSPRMFDYFTMGDAYNFINSPWGKLFNEAVEDGSKNWHHGDQRFKKFYSSGQVKKPAQERITDFIGGIRSTMVFEYKLRKVDRLKTALDEYFNSDEVGPLDPNRVRDLMNRREAEFSALQSSSPFWDVVIREIRDGDNSAFMQLKLQKGKMGKDVWVDAEDSVSGCKFWSSDKNDYNSLTEVMQDPYLPKTVKQQVMVDVVRFASGFKYFKAYEMHYQLEMEADAAYNMPTLLAYNEQPSFITEMQNANNRIKTFFRDTWKSVRTDVDMCYKKANDGDLDSYLKTLDGNPDLYLEIPNDFVVDAIEAQMDKTMRASEKSSQEIQVDGLFNALAMQRGGVVDTIYRVEAKTINKIDEELLSAYDVIRLLANPDLEIEVYNGRYTYPLSRKIICGDNTEEALWTTLKENPRIACLLRVNTVTANNKGTRVLTGARASLYQSMFEFSQNSTEMCKGKIKSALINRPMFNAMVAMFVSIHNRASRSVRPQHRKMLDAMQSLIVLSAAKATKKNMPADAIVSDVMENILGVTVDSLVKAGMQQDPAERWYQTLKVYLRKYITEVQTILVNDDSIQHLQDGSLDMSNIDVLLSLYDDDIAFEFDYPSIALAIDVRQTFTGAQTSTMTGVEGNITRNHLGTALYASMVQGRHEVIDGSMSVEELAPFVGCLTNYGVFDGVNIDALEDAAYKEGMPLVVEAREGYRKQDATLAMDGDQVTTLGRFISTNRGEAAEGGNLQAKKAGDDGKDSIIKFERYSENAAKNVGLVQRAYDDAENVEGFNNKLFAAKLKLAEILMVADKAEGYDDMDLGDWMDIADVMIKEVSNEMTATTPPGPILPGSVIVIRSIGEISSAIRHNLDQGIVENGSPYEIAQAAYEIADNVGIEGPVDEATAKYRALVALSGIQPNPAIRQFRPMAKPSEGTFERNYMTMTEITTHRRVTFPWSDKGSYDTRNFVKENKRENSRVFPFSKEAMKKTAEKLFEAGIPNWTPPIKMGKMNLEDMFYMPINITRRAKSNKKSITDNMSPGPQSVWILESGANKTDIKRAIAACYSFGMTLAFSEANALGDFEEIFQEDITEAPFGNNLLMIPFFNIRQSGGAINPPMAPESFDDHPSTYSVTWIDPYNYLSIPDAYIMVDERTAKNVNCSAAGPAMEFKIGDLFWNVLHDETVNQITGKRVMDMVHDIRIATWDEVRQDIVLNPTLEGVSFDPGIPTGNENIDDIVKKLDLQIEEYRRDFYSADAYGTLAVGRPDRIVSWMRCLVGSGDNLTPVYAPIIPSPTGTVLSCPTRFNIKGLTLANGNPKNIVYLDWEQSEPLDGQLVKVHDELNAAAKSETMFVPGQRIGELANGRIVNYMKPVQHDQSRNLGTEMRLQDMISLARAAKLDYKFNFAECPDAFPDNPDVKALLASRWISMDQWQQIHSEVKRYSTDESRDKFIRELVELCLDTGTTCPTDFLACRFSDGKVTCRHINYSFFFDPTPEFEDKLLDFYNNMLSNLCPPSIDSYGDGIDPITGQPYFFRPVNDPNSEFGHGALLVLGPPLKHPEKDAEPIRLWGHARYARNFFNDEATIMHKPGANGAHASLEQIAAISMSGKRVAGKYARDLAKYATAPAHKTYGWYDMHLDRGAFLRRER